MVLTSRFISCSRKSSLRPHGSAAVGQRVPVREVAAEARDLLADVGALRDAHDFLRDRRLVDRQRGRQLARRARAAAPRARRARRRRPPRVRSIRPASSALRASRSARRCSPFAHAHRVELVERGSRPPPRPPAPSVRRHAAGLRHALADARAPAAGAAGRPASARRRPARARAPASSAAASALRELLVQLDVRRRHLAQLQRDAELDAAARQPLLHQRAQPRLERRRATAASAAADRGTDG